MRKEHLDLLPQLHRDDVLVGLRNVAGDLAGIFMFFAADRAEVHVRAAACFRGAGLAGVRQTPVFSDALAGRPAVRIGIVPAELLQFVPLRADVFVVLRVPFEIGAGPGPVTAP